MQSGLQRVVSLLTSTTEVNRIVVTGPPRSGTRIASRILADDLHYQYIDESQTGYGFNENRWRSMLQRPYAVVHSPGMIKACIDNPPSRTLLVLMVRSIDAIHASEKRISDQLGEVYERPEFTRDPVIGAYHYWVSHKKLAPFIELDYEELSCHPLWVPADQRANFRIDQTSVE